MKKDSAMEGGESTMHFHHLIQSVLFNLEARRYKVGKGVRGRQAAKMAKSRVASAKTRTTGLFKSPLRKVKPGSPQKPGTRRGKMKRRPKK